MLIHLGLDSTDSPSGGCTTHTASKILDELQKSDPTINFIGYPRLIRLNPNIPIKTRGNAAISISIETTLEPSKVFEIAKSIVIADKDANLGEPHKKPGLVMKVGELEKNEIYSQGLQTVLTLENIGFSKLVDSYYPENANGLIGALCALYSDLSEDHTYELITYRKPASLGTDREIKINQLIKADKQFKSTFSSLDHNSNRELIAPSGPDPVFCGVRANSTFELHSFLNSLQIDEKLDSWTVFKSNQATDSHVNSPLSEISPYNVFSGELTIVSKPEELQGGHLKIAARVNNQSIVCMAFEPTKNLRNIVRVLIPSDRIYAHGNIRQNKFGISLAFEYFMISHLAQDIESYSPKCNCGTTMKSAGRFKGYKCPSCKTQSMIPQIVTKARNPNLFINQRVYASPSAQRHLTKPKSRLHRKNKNLRDEILSYQDVRNKL